MKKSRNRWQQGSIRKVPRAGGAWAWEYRYRQTDPDGVRRMKMQTFPSDKYPTKKSVWESLAPLIEHVNSDALAAKIEYTMGQLCDRYLRDELPQLAWSTQQTNGSLVKLHIKPRWERTRLVDLRPLAVKNWLDTLPFGSASKARTRNIISRMLDLAMLWELLPTVQRNPMQLIKIPGATKREKPLTILTMTQFLALVDELPQPIDLIVYIIGILGLRVSEALAFRWADINAAESTITVQRVYTHNRLKEFPKSDAGRRVLPLHPEVLRRLREWKKSSKPEDEDEYIFPGAKGTPRSDSTMLQDYIKPAAKKLGIQNIRYHVLRHSHKTWLADSGVPLTQQKDLLGHANISTTANVYGKTLTAEMRDANTRVVDALLKIKKKTRHR
jgi:integrase